jgi:putative heme-binding domain-containing protein
MLRYTWSVITAFFLLMWYWPSNLQTPGRFVQLKTSVDTLPNAQKWPSELVLQHFAGADLVPSPACMAVSPNGDVFVGVDMIGSLGKDAGKGKIVKLMDTNQDGKADKHSVFAMVDNPRGIIAMGDQVFVLHTTFGAETGKATGMDLVVFEDLNGDGVADGPSKPLIQNISSSKFLRSRGTDHATNGIRMGIDGWIYISVGDFGFHEAVDRSGKKLTMLGGGVVRVRPDGTEMEVFTHGMRNIYDVAIDPYMNIFARGNTNDGGGWNIRFSQQIQSGEYGYPLLFQNFTEEIIPAMVDLGGGSGTGSLFMDDATWPEKYNKVPMMADWGRNHLYIHRVTPSQSSFTQKEEDFIQLSQITDLDVDASGRLFLSAWDGAGYSGHPSKGFVVRAVPKNWKYVPFEDLKKTSVKNLVKYLKSGSGVARLHAQQELLRRSSKTAAAEGLKIANNKSLALDVRVAGIYTYAQAAGKSGIANLIKMTEDESVREFALKALADRTGMLADVPVAPFLKGLKDVSPRVQTVSIIALGRLGKKEVVQELLSIQVPASFVAPAKGVEGPHATPNTDIIPAHLAVRALVQMNAVEACVAAIEGGNYKMALWALRYMHDPKAVDGLIAAYKRADANKKPEIMATLARLYTKEAPYVGETWWGTRPDSHGPYYKGIEWAKSPSIKSLILSEYNQAHADQNFFKDLNDKFRMGIPELTREEVAPVQTEALVDLEKIKNTKGQVGKTSIEDVMLAIAKLEGNPEVGKRLFVEQGCVACHSIKKGEVMKGPFMGQIGSIMNREQIAESILKPNASISQGFASVLITAKKDKSYMGFITQESADKIVMRNMAGEVFTVKTADILTRQELTTSMMPEGLADALSYEEFASLLTYLYQQKK